MTANLGTNGNNARLLPMNRPGMTGAGLAHSPVHDAGADAVVKMSRWANAASTLSVPRSDSLRGCSVPAGTV